MPLHTFSEGHFKIIELKESEMIDQEMDRVHVDDGWLIHDVTEYPSVALLDAVHRDSQDVRKYSLERR